MSNLYVETGYVEAGYIEGDAVDISTATKKKINFIVDNKNLSDTDLNSLLLSQVGENYQDEVNIIFGTDLKIAETKEELFSISKVSGGISEEVIELINTNIADTNSQIDTLSNRVEEIANLTPTIEEVENSVLSNDTLLSILANAVIGKININIIAADGKTIATGLIYNSTKDTYILDYDTSLLDDTDYQISINLQ